MPFKNKEDRLAYIKKYYYDNVEKERQNALKRYYKKKIYIDVLREQTRYVELYK